MSVEVLYGDSLVVKIVHASHHQGSERYGNLKLADVTPLHKKREKGYERIF